MRIAIFLANFLHTGLDLSVLMQGRWAELGDVNVLFPHLTYLRGSYFRVFVMGAARELQIICSSTDLPCCCKWKLSYNFQDY